MMGPDGISQEDSSRKADKIDVVALAMTAWVSHSRHQSEAINWLRKFEQLAAGLSGQDKEEICRRTESL